MAGPEDGGNNDVNWSEVYEEADKLMEYGSI